MEFCSAVLEELRIRDGDGWTNNERTDGHTCKDHYIPPQICGGYCHVVNFEFTGWVQIQNLQHDNYCQIWEYKLLHVI